MDCPTHPWPPPGWQNLSGGELLDTYLERVTAEAEYWRERGEIERAEECEEFVRIFDGWSSAPGPLPAHRSEVGDDGDPEAEHRDTE